MFQTATGVTVPFPEKLSEQYELDGNTITANLSFEKLSDFVHSFYAELDEPLFIAIHPDAESDEVWYLDGMTKKQLTMILDGYGELLYQDGLSAFAIGSLTTEEELFVQKYKVLSIYSETAKRFVPRQHLQQAPAEKIRHGADRTSCHRMGYVLRRKARRRRAPRDRRSDRAGYD